MKALRLFVDSGFTGGTSFILHDDLQPYGHANLPSAQTAGALAGIQNRILVRCRIDSLAFQRNLSAVLAEIDSLSLPPDVQGMVGLTFLLQFQQWGATR